MAWALGAGQVHLPVDVITCWVGSGRREARHEQRASWMVLQQQGMDRVHVLTVVLWLLTMTAVTVFDLRSVG